MIKMLRKAIIYIICFILLYTFFQFLINYVHESGHILFGLLNLIFGNFPKIFISNWVNPLFIPMKIIPQQVTIENSLKILTPLILFGGPLFNLSLLPGIFVFGYKKTKDRKFLFLIIPIIIIELINIIGGTDNLSNSAYLNLGPFAFIINLISLSLLTILFISIINNKFLKNK